MGKGGKGEIVTWYALDMWDVKSVTTLFKNTDLKV
jgi:hypothetical protein